MAYIRSKTIKGKNYYYLVKSTRKEGKVRQKTLKYLGPQAPSQEEIKVLEKKYEQENTSE